ncbi:MAG: glycosyltransferase [Bacteroidaceae bacterium]
MDNDITLNTIPQNCSHEITVCLPVYNASKFLRECVDSILAQTFSDFELLIIDDGSTDNSVEIVCSYTDPRIRLIEKEHNYIGTINLLINEARGKYIARMDADDVMVKERLQIQYDYMGAHPEIDILGGGVRFFGSVDADNILYHETPITLERMLCACCISHSTVMLVRERINKASIRYDEDFVYAEDFHFWLQALKAGLCVKNIPQIVTRYRLSGDQVSSTHSVLQYWNCVRASCAFIEYHMEQVNKELELQRTLPVAKTGNSLTLILPFMNDGINVLNTVLNLRETVGEEVDILVVDDCSDDGYDYAADLKSQPVTYIRNPRSMGINVAKELAVQLSTTPFFMFLDIGMCLSDKDDVAKIVERLQENDRQLLACTIEECDASCGNVRYLYGAYLNMDGNVLYNMKTISSLERRTEERTLPCVLGYGYAAGKRYWNHLKGLQGLTFFGVDGAYVSIKTELEGGDCGLLPDVKIRSTRRTELPFPFDHFQFTYNYYLMIETLFPEGYTSDPLRKSPEIDEMVSRNIHGLMERRSDEVEALKTYYRSIGTRSMDYVLQINEDAKTENRITNNG